jgi:hypothetical protein
MLLLTSAIRRMGPGWGTAVVGGAYGIATLGLAALAWWLIDYTAGIVVLVVLRGGLSLHVFFLERRLKRTMRSAWERHV